jgi:DNA-binding FrmR family transcriptional regulator
MSRARTAAPRPDVTDQRRQIVERLNKIEGQVRGIARMVGDERDCEAVLTQVLAVKAALDRAAAQIASGFVGECLHDDGARAEARITRVMSLLARTG